MTNSLSNFRKNYTLSELNEANAPSSPFDLFSLWFDDAVQYFEGEANAMVLSTTSKGKPSSRIVLLKEFSEKGFVFFTNYISRKGKEIAENPAVALLFYWPGMDRQIRIEGMVTKISEKESDKYFASRPEESRIGAVISPQSQPIPDRKFLEERFNEASAIYAGDIPRPGHWGGYQVNPVYFEFWQGRPGRLHDRLTYHLKKKAWGQQRLAP